MSQILVANPNGDERSGRDRQPNLVRYDLKGLPEAIASVFPNATIQTCVMHLVRRSLSFVNDKERKAVAADLKPIYQALTEAEAWQALEQFQSQRDKKYPVIARVLARELEPCQTDV